MRPIGQSHCLARANGSATLRSSGLEICAARLRLSGRWPCSGAALGAHFCLRLIDPYILLSCGMQITVALPSDIAHHPNGVRGALVIEGYRSRQLTQREAGQMLGLSRVETEDFLGAHAALCDYAIEELEDEAELLQRLHRRS
jgi:hypothetical protein